MGLGMAQWAGLPGPVPMSWAHWAGGAMGWADWAWRGLGSAHRSGFSGQKYRASKHVRLFTKGRGIPRVNVTKIDYSPP